MQATRRVRHSPATLRFHQLQQGVLRNDHRRHLFYGASVSSLRLAFAAVSTYHLTCEAVLPALISTASYMFTHASASSRSRSYARLVLLILLVLVEEGARSLSSNTSAATIRLCRQRQPQLPFVNDTSRPPLCAILDCLLVFFRHNLHRRLDVDAYM
jgi:hypothetical protein